MADAAQRGALIGAAMMSAGALAIPVGDSYAKVLTAEIGLAPGFVAFARFAVALAVTLPVALVISGPARFTRRAMAGHVARGAMLAGAVGLIIKGAQSAPLADVFGAFFIGPAVAALLALTVLGERVRAAEAAALALGLLGVALVLRPGGEVSPGLLWALGGGVFYGAYNAASRWSAGAAPPAWQLAGQFAVAALILAPFGAVGVGGFAVAPWPLLWSGLWSVAGNMLIVSAYRFDRTAALAPLIYLQLVSAAVLGWWRFDATPEATGALGLVLILIAGLGPWTIARLRRA